jgi:LmbE family N-acetylglucosaminyl deacetylase
VINQKEYFAGKKVLVVVAHHDDEVFTFGPLLVSIFRVVASMVIIAMSDLRDEKFQNACIWLNAKPITIAMNKYSKSESYYIEDALEISEKLKPILLQETPDVVITHGTRIEGEHYHPYHIMVCLGTKHAVGGKLPVVIRSDCNVDITVPYGKKARNFLSIYDFAKWNNALKAPHTFSIIERFS